MHEVVFQLYYWLMRHNVIGDMGKIKLIVEFEDKSDFCNAEAGFKMDWQGGHQFNQKIDGIEVQFRTRPTHGS